MWSVISHTEIQIIGLAASKSVEKPGALGGLFSSCNVYLVTWISVVSPFYSLLLFTQLGQGSSKFWSLFSGLFYSKQPKVRNYREKGKQNLILCCPFLSVKSCCHHTVKLDYFFSPACSSASIILFFFPVCLKFWLFRQRRKCPSRPALGSSLTGVLPYRRPT